ncbi:hypothetical protein ACPESR_12030 [Nocardia testacea]|uniref:hypothetical protein n=1 Tax=Nocardia testacea TaxID=248551 RepID=UPI003C2EB017
MDGTASVSNAKYIALLNTWVTAWLNSRSWAAASGPELLGAAIGRGGWPGPRITAHIDDLPFLLAYCERVGLTTSEPQRTHGGTFRFRFASGSRGGAPTRIDRALGLNALRQLDILGNKHIPTQVKRIDWPIRMQVLRGLMDSDGTIDPNGKIELCFAGEQLALDSIELLRSLGFYPRMRESDATLRGRAVGKRYRINFTGYSDDPVFLLPRKAARLKARPSTFPYSQVRTVTAIDRVGPASVRYLSVSGPNRLFLAGKGLVPK